MSSRRPSSDPPQQVGRLVIVCAYPDGMLANSWFRAYRRVKRAVRRRGFDAQVELAPVTDLPSRVDVLVVPPSLGQVTRAGPGVGELLVVPPESLQPALEQLIEGALREGRLQSALAPDRRVAVHRGFQAVAERARFDD